MASSTHNDRANRLLSSRRPWLFAFVLMSGVFVCGVIMGVVITSGFLWNKTINTFRPPGIPVGRLMEDMQRDLLLSEEQAGKTKAIFTSHLENIKAIREEFDPRMEAELESLRKKIEAVLNDEQAKRWNQRFNTMKRDWRPPPPRPHPGPPPPPGPPPGPPPQGL